MSGFGSTILALTWGVHLYPMGVLLPVLVSLDLLVNLYIVTRHHQHINQSLLYRTIIPNMGIGLLAGLVAFYYIQGDILEKIFGFLVIGLSIRELYRLFRKKQDQGVLSNLNSAVYITQDSMILILILLPMIVVGIILGEWLHHQIDEYRFKIFIFAVLLFAGLSIIIT